MPFVTSDAPQHETVPSASTAHPAVEPKLARTAFVKT
jgi:hypothetical protein